MANEKFNMSTGGYNLVVAKLAVKSWPAKRNPEISLDIFWEKCTGRFDIVSSDGNALIEMH